MMLECKTYTYAEFSALFNTRDNQGIKRRLDRWGIKYSTAGRGTGLKYTIEDISDPFVPFCILDLGFAPQTFFDKLNLFLYYFLNDKEFAGLPCEMMERRIENDGYTLSRQTIEKYLRQLDHQDLILRASGNYHYYFARRGRLIDTTKEKLEIHNANINKVSKRLTHGIGEDHSAVRALIHSLLLASNSSGRTANTK